jgi:uncharacterized protein
MTGPPEYRRHDGPSLGREPARPRRLTRQERQAQLRRRRLFALLAILGIVLLVVIVASIATSGKGPSTGATGPSATPSPSGSHKPKPSPTALAVPSKQQPLRLFAGGDSMGGELAAGMVPILYKTNVVKPTAFYKVSSGLSRPDFYDWIDYWRKYSYRYKAIVFMVGTNDGQNMVGKDGKIFQFPTDAWRAEYKRRAGQVMDIMHKAGVQRVYWVSMPIMGSANFSSIMRAINAGFRDAAETRSWVDYVDIWKVFSTRSGAYDAKWRQDDGVHFNFDGVHRLAKYVAGVVEQDWKITSASSSSGTDGPASPSPSP